MSEPRLAVILATDTYATIRGVVERIRRQTIAAEIELVLVAPSQESVGEVLAYRGEFAAVRIVENPVKSLPEARAAGIRASTAPFVFVGETHSYPLPGFGAAILERFHAGPWSAVTPAIGNAMPKGVLSWAGFLSDYAAWAEGLPEGEVPEAPLYNAGYRREALAGLGERLAPALDHGDELWVTLRAQGHRSYLDPRARLDHVSLNRPWPWVHERFLAGLLIAASRAKRWHVGRRIAYAAGSPLIPVVLLWRAWPGIRKTARAMRLPWATLPVIAAGMFVKAAGEMVGYAGLCWDGARRAMHEYEVHRLRYVRTESGAVKT